MPVISLLKQSITLYINVYMSVHLEGEAPISACTIRHKQVRKEESRREEKRREEKKREEKKRRKEIQKHH